MLLLWLTCMCTALDLSLTVVLLCELLIGGRQHVCGAGLIAAQRVRVHRGAVQHQWPLLQLAWGNRSILDTDPLQSVLMANSWISFDRVAIIMALRNRFRMSGSCAEFSPFFMFSHNMLSGTAVQPASTTRTQQEKEQEPHNLNYSIFSGYFQLPLE